MKELYVNKLEVCISIIYDTSTLSTFTLNNYSGAMLLNILRHVPLHG